MSARKLLTAALSLTSLTTLASLSPLAHAESVHGTRSDKLKEVAHTAELRLDRGFAELVVRRTVDNGGPRHDQAMFGIDLPPGAVATGLRTLGTLDGQPHWFAGELMEAEAAAEKYRELTGIGGYYPKDPALLSWRHQGHLMLQVFPVPPGEKKTIEYTLILPTRYESGRDELDLGRLGTPELAPEIVVRPARAEDTVMSAGLPLASGAKLTSSSGISLSLVRARPQRLAGALAVVPFGADKVLYHQRVEVAERLSTLPSSAQVVVVLDASRSRSDDAVAASVSAARAYVGHMRGADVAVVSFDREAHTLLDFAPAASTEQAMRTLAIKRRNGSHVDLGLARAAELLAGRKDGARRVLLFTDTLVRDELKPEPLRAALARAGALVHVVRIENGGASLTRDDEHAWVTATRATGGLVWTGSAPAKEVPATERGLFEELARPVRLHRLRFTLSRVEMRAAADLGPDQFPETLQEGEGFDLLRLIRSSVGGVRVEGEAWTVPVSASFAPDAEEAKRWSALVFGSQLLSSIPEEAMMPLAKRGHAVTPVTSLLAIEPGVRPSTEGLEEGLTGVGSGGGGVGHGIGLGRVGRISFDTRGFLESSLSKAWKTCGGKVSATVALETTVAEVVDVRRVTGEGATDRELRCLREATWDLELPEGFRAEHATFDVTVR